MKILITEEQYKLIKEEFGRDWIDDEYADEYPKYKDMLINAIKMDIKAWGENDTSILMAEDGNKVIIDYRKKSKTLYYDYDFADGIERLLPWHIYVRHFKYALYDFFKGIFPTIEIKNVTGANITYY